MHRDQQLHRPRDAHRHRDIGTDAVGDQLVGQSRCAESEFEVGDFAVGEDQCNRLGVLSVPGQQRGREIGCGRLATGTL